MEDPALRKPIANATPNVPVLPQLGLAVRPLLPVEQRAAEASYGLMVEGVQEVAEKAGIAPGDILLAINQVPVTSVEQARALLAQAKGSVALLVLHEGDKNFVAMEINQEQRSTAK
jgi:serine protease Do